MADNLQNKAVEQAVNYFQVSELQFIIFCLLILVLWFIGTYYLQSRFQKNVMKDIALQKEEIEKRLRNIDYKNDYYKKIIDKRMMAYEELERFLSDIDVETDMTFYGIANKFRGDSYHCYMFSCVRSQIKRYLNQSVKICGYNSWYSKKLEGLVNRLNVDFAKYFDQTTRGIEFTNGIIVGSRQDDLDNFDIMLPNGLIVTKGQFHLPKNIVINEEDIKYYVKAHDVLIGVQWFNEFKETFAEIRAVMIEDRLRLHEVEKFLNDKKAS